MLLAVPALRALRRARPGAPLILAAQPRIGGLLARLGAVDRAVAFDGLGLESLFVDAPGPAPRLVREAGRVVCWFGARDPTFVARLRALVPGATVAAPAEPDAPVWTHLLGTVGADARDVCDPLVVSAALRDEGRQALIAAGWDGSTPPALVHPGGGSVAKRWATEGFAIVVDALARAGHLGVVVHEGPADADAVHALVGRARARLPVLRDPPLAVLAGALGHARLYLGNDSGVSHLAAAVGVPSVVLFRETLLGWRPWSAAARPLVVSIASLERADVRAVLEGARALLG